MLISQLFSPFVVTISVNGIYFDLMSFNEIMMQNYINKQPPFEVLAEDMSVHKKLQEFNSLPSQISHVVDFLTSIKADTTSIKQKTGISDYYLELSTLVVDKALTCVIQGVNEAQKEKSEENLAQMVCLAWQATLLMDSFDKEKNFGLHYQSNRKILEGIYKKILLSNSISQEMIEYYRAIDIFNGTVRKEQVSFKQESSDVLGEHVIKASKNILGLNEETNRYFQFAKVTALLDKTLKILHEIKSAQTISNQEYLHLSTRVVSMALNNVIEIVNKRLSSSETLYVRQYGFDTKLESAIFKAHTVMRTMSLFDMTEDFRNHFNEQQKAIAQICERINPWNRYSAQRKEPNSSNNSGCMVMPCALIGLIVLTIFMCV